MSKFQLPDGVNADDHPSVLFAPTTSDTPPAPEWQRLRDEREHAAEAQLSRLKQQREQASRKQARSSELQRELLDDLNAQAQRLGISTEELLSWLAQNERD